MKLKLVLLTLATAWSAHAAFLPYMKVTCRDVQGVFAAKDTMVVFELKETKTGNLSYMDIVTDTNGIIGFSGQYFTNYYKLKPDGQWGEMANEGLLKLVSKSNETEITLPNCLELR